MDQPIKERVAERYPVKKKAEPFFYKNAANDTVAVLVHGFTGSPNDMRELADYLFQKGIDVYAVRLAGHGSHYSDLIQTSHADWWLSVRDAVTEVEKTHRRIFLIGYSFGSNIILDLAARNPEKYNGIICLGVSIFSRIHKAERLMYYFFRAIGKKKWRKPYVPKGKIESFESGGNYAHIPIKNARDVYHFIDSYTKNELPRVTTPALIIHSRDDKISHPKSSEYLFEHLGSKQKEMFILNEPNHNPLRSDNKNKIFERVVNFIEE